jgi:hypothetical protein
VGWKFLLTTKTAQYFFFVRVNCMHLTFDDEDLMLNLEGLLILVVFAESGPETVVMSHKVQFESFDK